MKCPFKKNVTYKRDDAGRIVGRSEKFWDCDKDKRPFYSAYYAWDENDLKIMQEDRTRENQ